jgi:hypothetical protein
MSWGFFLVQKSGEGAALGNDEEHNAIALYLFRE